MFGSNRALAAMITGLLITLPAAGQTRVAVSWEVNIVGVNDEMESDTLAARRSELGVQWAQQFKTIIPVFDFVAGEPAAGDIQLKVVAYSVGTRSESDLWTGYKIRLPDAANDITIEIKLYKPNEWLTLGGMASQKLEDVVKRFHGMIFEIEIDNMRAVLLPNIPLGQRLEQCFNDATGAVDTKRSVIRVPPALWRRYTLCEFAVEYLTSQGVKEAQVNGTGKLHENDPNGVIVSHDPLIDVDMWLKVTIKRWRELRVPASSGQAVLP